MQDAEISAWLALHHTPGLTDKVFTSLIKATSHPEEIFSLSKDRLRSCGVTSELEILLKRQSHTLAEQHIQTIHDLDIQLIPISHIHYPELLKQISSPPPLIYTRGNIDLLETPQLAVVGSRRTSRQGLENAFSFSRELSKAGFTITSGLAVGIDTESHLGALAFSGNTIGVLGTGIDKVYPARNQDLFENMYQKSLVLSEFPLGTPPLRHCFPRRNRIISGLSLGVLVIEAALKSGSLITARMALEQNREVFAIPSSIHNSGGKGCNELIKQGAKLVEKVDDIIEEFNGWSYQQREILHQPCSSLTEAEQQLIDIMGFDPISIDLLASRVGFALPELSGMLTSLEIRGLIAQEAGLYQRLKTFR